MGGPLIMTDEVLDVVPRQPPYCERHLPDREIEMEPDTRYHGVACMRVRVWRCPECGRVVTRGEDPEVDGGGDDGWFQ